MRNAVFIFLNKTSGRKYIKTIALVSFQHLLRTLPVSYQNDLCDHLFYMHSVYFDWIFFHIKKKNPKSYLYTRIMIESVKSLYNQFGDRAELYSIKYHDKIKM